MKSILRLLDTLDLANTLLVARGDFPILECVGQTDAARP